MESEKTVIVGVIDYDMGNLYSVVSAFENQGVDVFVVKTPQELERCDKLVLPGVGAFAGGISNLRRLGFIPELNRLVLENGVPILGICLGMQMMARSSTEGGVHEGLGWFDAEVVSIRSCYLQISRSVHMGWNDISYCNHPLFKGLGKSPDFYFAHAYFMLCRDSTDVAAVADYGGPVTAVAIRKNICCTQFHPEKSQSLGAKLLRNFIAL